MVAAAAAPPSAAAGGRRLHRSMRGPRLALCRSQRPVLPRGARPVRTAFTKERPTMLTKSRRAFVSCAVLLMFGSVQSVLAEDMTSFATGGYARELRTAEMMDKIDANGDHMVSKAEWDAYAGKAFAMMDADNSGVLDHDEFMTAKSSEMVSFSTGGFASAFRTSDMLAKIDADHDGKVTRAEFSAFQDKVFASMDTSGKKMLDKFQFFGNPAN